MMLAFLLLLTPAFIYRASADGLPSRLNENSAIKTYVIINTTANGTVTNVPITTIIPGVHRILGITCTPSVSGAGTNLFAVADSTTLALLTWPTTTANAQTGLVFGESIAANTAQNPLWFPYPKRLTYGLSVMAGPGTEIVIYYEEYHY